MLDGYRKSIAGLRDQQASVLIAFLQRRCREETDLDFDKLKRHCFPYIEWIAEVTEAARRSLARRKWHAIGQVLDELAAAALDDVRKNPASGARRLPTLLSNAFFLHDYLDRLNNPQSRLLAVDLHPDLQTGIALLGEAEAQSLDGLAKTAATLAMTGLLSDVQSGGEQSLRIPPETVPALKEFMVGGRQISGQERTLVGRWIYQDFYFSGGFSARTELHMILLANGACARTGKTVASSTFRDSSGNWAGFMDSASNLEPGERGKWTYDGRLLTLTMDDGSVYEYRITSSSGKSMMTRNTTSGEDRLWSRS
jgi:hypothetical protein